MVNLPVAVKPSDQVQPKIRPTPDGGSYISWFDNDPNGHPPFGYDVYLQRLSEKGYVRWHDKGLRLADLGMSSTQDYGLDVDADGNALLAFLDDRTSSDNIVTAVKVSKSGVPLWGRNGKHPGLGTEFKGNPKITATSDGFAVVGWINGNNLTFQRFDSAGNAQWGTAGITVTAPNGLTYSLADLHGGDNGSAIFSFGSPRLASPVQSICSPTNLAPVGRFSGARITRRCLMVARFNSAISRRLSPTERVVLFSVGMRSIHCSHGPNTSSPVGQKLSPTTERLDRRILETTR